MAQKVSNEGLEIGFLFTSTKKKISFKIYLKKSSTKIKKAITDQTLVQPYDFSP